MLIVEWWRSCFIPFSSAFTTVGVTATLQDNVFSGVGDGTVSPSPGTVDILIYVEHYVK